MMINSRFLFFVFMGVCIAGIVLLALYLLINRGAMADHISNKGRLVDRIVYGENIDNDGAIEEIAVTKYQENDKNSFYLEIDDSTNSEVKLEGYENNVHFCDQEIIRQKSGEVLVCLVGYVGAHSENLQLVSYHNNELEVCKFDKNGSQNNNITSDSPNFVFKDFNNDSNYDVAVDYRDYTADPLADIIRMYYHFNTGCGFVFNNEEKINQTQNANGQGQISLKGIYEK